MKYPKTNPACPNVSNSHGTYRAVRDRKCICDGPGHHSRQQERERNRVRRAATRAARRDQPHTPVPTPQLAAPASLPRITTLERRLLERDDLPCQETDPELFSPDPDLKPTERQFRETVAKAICGGCGFRTACLQIALDIDDRWTLRAGTTPAERKTMKKQGAA